MFYQAKYLTEITGTHINLKINNSTTKFLPNLWQKGLEKPRLTQLNVMVNRLPLGTLCECLGQFSYLCGMYECVCAFVH